MKLYPIVDVMEWCKAYGLSQDPVICPNCNCGFNLEVPFVTKALRGIEAKPHSCGDRFKSYRVINLENKLTDAILGQLKQDYKGPV